MSIEEAIIHNDKLPATERLSNVKLAEKLNVSEKTIRRRRKKVQKRAQEGVDEFFGVPKGAVKSRGKTVRLADGSYEKITYDYSVSHAENFKKLAVDDVIRSLSEYHPNKTTNNTRGTLIVSLADFQVGKTDENGGTEELMLRISQQQQVIVDYAQKKHFRQIVLVDVGDSTEGFGNVSSQAQTNDLSITDQIRVVQQVFLSFIKKLYPLCEQMLFVSVPSNHCEVRVGTGKGRANSPDDDFGLLIHDTLKMCLENSPLKDVQFLRTTKWEESVCFETEDGTWIAAVHGHQAGSQDKMKNWFRDQAFGQRSGMELADVLLHGHFHNFRVSLAGNERWIISSPTADNGSSWFANKTGESTSPCILTFETDRGEAKNWKLWH